jgi:hypothetical protein
MAVSRTIAISALIDAAKVHAETLRRHADVEDTEGGRRVVQADAARWQSMADAAEIELTALL